MTALGHINKIFRSLQRSPEEAASAGIANVAPERPNKEEVLQSDAGVGAGMVTLAPCNVLILGKKLVEIIRPELVDPGWNRLEVQSTALARAEEKRLIRKCETVVKRM